MWLRMLRDWRAYRLGRVLNVPDGQANVMIRRHIAEQIADPADEDATNSSAGRRSSKESRRGGNSRL